jgi:hypothetical protein
MEREILKTLKFKLHYPNIYSESQTLFKNILFNNKKSKVSQDEEMVLKKFLEFACYLVAHSARHM